MRLLSLIAFLYAIGSHAWASAAPDRIAVAREHGTASYAEYASMAIGGGPQNTEVVELADRRIAVANSAALLVFDGQRWRAFKHPEQKQKFNSLALTPDGRMYSGVDGEFGYFAIDATGEPHWHSLMPELPKDVSGFGPTVQVLFDSEREKLWFLTAKTLFLIDPKHPMQVQRFTTNTSFKRIFRVGADIWISEFEIGVKRVVHGNAAALLPVPHLDQTFHSLIAVTDAGDKRLVFLADGRIFRWQESAVTEVLDPQYRKHSADLPIGALRLRDGRYAVKFKRHPPCLFRFDLKETVVQCLPETDGTVGNVLPGMLQDSGGVLWLAQSNFVTKIDVSSGLSFFGRQEGISVAQDIARVNGTLFVATLADVKRLVPGGIESTGVTQPKTTSAHFDAPWPALTPSYALASIEQTLFVSGTGVHRIDLARNKPPEMIFQSSRATSLLASRFHPDRLWVGTIDGVFELDGATSTKPVATKIIGIDADIRQLVEENPNTLWAADGGGKLWRIAGSAGNISVESMHSLPGLAAGQIRFGQAPNSIWFLTTDGIRQFEPRERTFVAPPGLPNVLVTERVFSLLEDDDGNLWVRCGTECTGVAWRRSSGAGAGVASKNAQWQLDRTPFSAIDVTPTVVKFLREGNIVWGARVDGLVRLDLSQHTIPDRILPIVTRLTNLNSQIAYPLSSPLTLASNQRNVRFNFALPQMHRSEAVRFRTKLQGFDTEFSPWTERNERDYTNLPDGNYKFSTEARDSFGRDTTAQDFVLQVSPPWSRSKWAYASYFIAALFALWLAAKLGARQRQHTFALRQKALEATVAERTEELTLSNAKLAEHAQRLTELDKLKTNFFINVGHEFRTPLTLVLGPIDDLLRDASERFSARAREQLEMANRNARRVLDLIVELLDVNRFEHGKMQLMRLPTDVDALVRRCVAESAELMLRFGHQLRFERDDAHSMGTQSAWLAAIDVVQIERCISNLIGNAAKYMTRGGVIEVSLARTEAHILISVNDHGRGIAPEAVSHIFDRFFQTENSDRASGYGIGLALVHQIIEAHQGRIGVESILGLGSRFQIELAALASEQSQQLAEPTPALEARKETHAALIQELPAERVRVLIVDDHDDMRARVRALLEKAPSASDAQSESVRPRFEVIEANDGPSAWLACCDNLPDLIVCDVMMPGFDGVELSRRLRANPDTATIPLLLLTAKVGSGHAVAGLNAGADDYLAKPFDASELLARVDALLARGQRLRLRMLREAQAASVALIAPKDLHEDASSKDIAATESRADLRWRERLARLIETHLSDAEWGIEALSAAMHVDRTHLFRKCKELLGASPSDYLRDARLRRACELLSTGAGNISEIAYAVGFVSLSSFTRAFKTRYSIAPSQMQKAHSRQAS